MAEVVGQRVKKLRTAAGVSLERLAEQTGLAKTTITRIEQGHVSPTVSTLQRIARALKVKVRALIPNT